MIHSRVSLRRNDARSCRSRRRTGATGRRSVATPPRPPTESGRWRSRAIGSTLFRKTPRTTSRCTLEAPLRPVLRWCPPLLEKLGWLLWARSGIGRPGACRCSSNRRRRTEYPAHRGRFAAAALCIAHKRTGSLLLRSFPPDPKALGPTVATAVSGRWRPVSEKPLCVRLKRRSFSVTILWTNAQSVFV